MPLIEGNAPPMPEEIDNTSGDLWRAAMSAETRTVVNPALGPPSAYRVMKGIVQRPLFPPHLLTDMPMVLPSILSSCIPGSDSIGRSC